MGVPISNVTRRVVYAASGTGPYAFTFEILANTDIAVYRDDTLLTLTTDYTVTIAANGTGSITLVASPTGATQIAIVGNRSIQRTTDFVTGGDFFANTVNDEMDQQTIFAQQNAEGLGRALQAPQTDPTTINMVLPRATVRANKVLSFDSLGNPNATELIGSYRGNWTSGTAYFVRDLVKDTSNGNIYQVNTAHNATGSLPISTNADAAKFDLIVDTASATQSASDAAASAALANDWATKTSGTVAGGEYSAKYHATAASSSASAASSSASNASTSASNASTSATNAANSATAASGSATTASTQATNAASSATAAAGSATAASGSASAASGSASTASTQATNASNSATAASTSASNASTSATNAANSATAASGSASTASGHATNAATSATNASNSATDAATSASAAAASYDAFDDRYLGAKSSNPSVDNDGNALLTGAIYFNSTAMVMRVWNGTTWQDQAASPDTIAERSFSATAGQTSYTFTGGYRVGYTYVYVNGSLLAAADITATNGTTITFASALALNDEVRILSYKAIGSVAIADISGLQAALDAKAATITPTITGLREVKTVISASAIDLSVGNYFTKTISGATTFTISNTQSTGTAHSFILDLTNGGSATVTWWSGVKWAGGTAPTLTSAGRDVLGFFTHDGGTTWSGLVLGKDVK